MKARRYLLIGLHGLAAAALLYGISGAQSDPAKETSPVVRAQRIELVDSHGVTRARLSTEANGEVVLRLLAANGDIRVKLAASDEGSGLVLLNGATEPGAQVLAKRTGTTLKLKAGDRDRVIEP